MQDQKTATLTAIFSEVLQNLAFMFNDDDDGEVIVGEVWLETEMGYRGPRGGNLRFRCSRDFSILLAANLLGTDPESVDSPARANDAVKEFMNIVCGQLITALHGTEEAFDLTIPELRELQEAPDLSVTRDAQSSTLCVQGHRLQLVYVPE